MARTEARIFVDIWDDPDFLAISAGAQRLYLFLISQPDLAHDGVMPLRERRWARTARDLKLRLLLGYLDELIQAKFVIVDEDTEELLVRSFVRRDGVCRQPNLIRAARAHLPLVRSAAIRAALVEELRRLLDDESLLKTRDLLALMLTDLSQGSAMGPPTARPNPSVNPSGDPSANPSGSPSPNGSANPTPGALGERGMVTDVSTGFPFPLSPEPLPLAPLAADASLREPPAPTTQTLVAEWIDHCRTPPSRRTIGVVAKQIKALLDDRQDPEHIRAGLDLWRRKGADPSALHSFVNQAANAEPRASPEAAASTGTQRAQAALDAGAIVQAALDRKEITP